MVKKMEWIRKEIRMIWKVTKKKLKNKKMMKVVIMKKNKTKMMEEMVEMEIKLIVRVLMVHQQEQLRGERHYLSLLKRQNL